MTRTMKKLLYVLLAAAMLISVGLLTVQADDEEPLLVEEYPDLYLSSSPDTRYDLRQYGLTEQDIAELKAAITKTLVAHEEYVDIEKYQFPTNSNIMNVLEDFIVSECGGYFVETSYGSYSGVEYYCNIHFYKYDADETVIQIENAAHTLLNGIEYSDLTDVEKALLIHDRLDTYCEYDKIYYTQGSSAIPHVSHTIYGCLINRICVCDGYAKTYCYLMNMVGVHTRLCTSRTLNHAWNIVTIDGEDYYVDVTWDDPTYDLLGRATHDYFLVSHDALRDHTASDYDPTPDDTRFDEMFWQDVDSSFQLLDGKIYYINNNASCDGIYLWEDGKSTLLLDFDTFSDNIWYASGGGYYGGNFSKLGCDGNLLYFNMSKTVYSYDPFTDELRQLDIPENVVWCNLVGLRAQPGLIELRLAEEVWVGLNDPENTWLRYGLAVVEPEIKCAQISLGTDISMDFCVQLPAYARGSVLTVNMHGEETTLTGVFDIETGLWVYTFTGITPQAMGDLIDASLTLNDTELDSLDDYSVVAYCQNLMQKSASELGMTDDQYANMKTLIADLLNYGAAAQVYREYNTNNLVNEHEIMSDLTPTTFISLDATAASSLVTTTECDTKLSGAGIVFDYTNSLYIRFAAVDCEHVTVVLSTGETYDADDFMKNGDSYLLILDPMTASEMASLVYTIELKVDEITVQTLRYGLASYVYAKQGQGTNMSALAEAVYNYGLSAAAYKEIA